MSRHYATRMPDDRPSRTVFPLRFESERTRELLRLVAQRQGTSMNRLAEELIARELEVLALGLELSLSRTVELLRSYRGDLRAEAWSEFAEAESLPEPVQGRRTHPDADHYGVGRAFAVEA